MTNQLRAWFGVILLLLATGDAFASWVLVTTPPAVGPRADFAPFLLSSRLAGFVCLLIIGLWLLVVARARRGNGVR